MTVIDTHHHFLPPRYIDRVGEEAIASLLVSGRVPSWDPQQTLDAMDRNEIEKAILSLSSPAVCALPKESRSDLARYCNEYAATMDRDFPGRFGSLSTLPLPDVDDSLRELAYCMDELKCDGFCVLSNYAGHYLGDRLFDPIFSELNHRAATVFVHPTTPLPHAASVGLPAASLEFPFDTTRTIGSLLFAGSLS